ncbi:MAG: hypothetical protein ACOY93_22295 [Bacillota bacterium]
MNGSRRMNPWLAALLSWALATGLVTGGYAIWLYSQGQPMRWNLVGEAALIAVPLALFRAWRDRGSD